MDNYLKGQPYIKGFVCPRGHKIKAEIDKDLRKTYPFICPTCDENYFKFEVKEVKNA